MPPSKHIVDECLSGGPGRRICIAHGRPPNHRVCVLCGGSLQHDSVIGYHVKLADGTCRDVWVHVDCMKRRRGHPDVRRTIGRYHLLMVLRGQNRRVAGRSQTPPERIG